jgi:hypothetical protein
MPILACEAPPRKIDSGGYQYTEFCNQPGRTWDASKGGHTAQVVRCDTHAALLRGNGYEVRLAASETEKKPKWDLTSTNSLEAAAGYLRKNAGAQVVIVIREHDAVIAVDVGIAAEDVHRHLFRALPGAIERLEAKQEADRHKRVHNQIQSGVNPEEMRHAG